jgi:chromosome segregation ATPase
MFSMTFCLSLVLAGTSCQEHKRLASELASTKAELPLIQAQAAELQDEINQLNQQNVSLRTHPSVRRGMGAFEQQVHNLEKEVTGLTERKNSLDAEIAALRKDLTDYRAKHQR